MANSSLGRSLLLSLSTKQHKNANRSTTEPCCIHIIPQRAFRKLKVARNWEVNIALLQPHISTSTAHILDHKTGRENEIQEKKTQSDKTAKVWRVSLFSLSQPCCVFSLPTVSQTGKGSSSLQSSATATLNNA